MEKLKQLRVQGFRSLRDVDLELGDRTVLVGANGSGKSNLIELLAMVRELVHGDLQVYVARKGRATSTLHYGANHTPKLSLSLEFTGTPHPFRYDVVLAFSEPDRLSIFSEEILSVGPDGKGDSVRSAVGGLETSMPPFTVDMGDAQTQSMVQTVLGFLENVEFLHFRDTMPTARIRTSHDIRRNRFLMGDGGNLSAFLYMLKAAHPQHYARILSTVRFAVPHVTDFILEPDPLNAGIIQLGWRDRNPDYEFGPHQLSDGSLRAIALITTLLQPEELLPSLIVIDEPEIGLHPSAIGVIASLIKAVSMKRQVIVATQSPRLIADFAPEDVVVVEREEDDQGFGESVFHRLSAEELGDWVKDYDLGTLFEMNVTGGGPR